MTDSTPSRALSLKGPSHNFIVYGCTRAQLPSGIKGSADRDYSRSFYISIMAINHDMRSMFYGAKPDIFRKAEQNRTNPTPSEAKLWEVLRENQLGFRFKRQHPISLFIADFYCHKLKLVVEVDGGSHHDPDQIERDKYREAELQKLGLKISRYSDDEVLNDTSMVVEQLKRICSSRETELNE